MARYTKKPVTVEAEQWTGENLLDICRLTGRCGGELRGEAGTLKIKTLEGTMTARPGDYIIKGVAGECYPCKPDIFAKTYCKTEDGPKFEPGQLVWVIERDMEGNAYGPAGYVFLAQVAYAAIVTPQINGVKDLSYAVDWHIRETCFSQATDGLSVFPIKDCYGTSDEAKAAKTAEEEDILGDTYDLDRLRKLLEADREGRCVVLPSPANLATMGIGRNVRSSWGGDWRHPHEQTP